MDAKKNLHRNSMQASAKQKKINNIKKSQAQNDKGIRKESQRNTNTSSKTQTLNSIVEKLQL
jgi:hypothetical protein